VIRSMTGFGSAGLDTEGMRAAVSARSVNHRYLDVTLHVPRRLQPLEAEIRDAVSRVVRRGRVELSVQASLADGAPERVVASRPLVASLVRTLRDMQNEFGLEGGVSVSDLVRFPGALERAEAAPAVSDDVRAAVLGLVGKALEDLEAMRRAEGGRLREDLERALAAIEQTAEAIEERARQTRELRKADLVEKVRTVLAELGLDESRLYQEAVRAVERHDVAEEIQRLRSHVTMARELLTAEGAPAGKRLDFLAQELLREANTVGSKTADAALVRVVVELKAEVERLREQVQNVE
jgi:uncharacterized protein (TIGR00255 family)